MLFTSCFNGTNIHDIPFFLLQLGCSDQGKFGENCSMLCPSKCLKSRCDITNGTCFECTVGYLGPTCESDYCQCFKVYG